MLRKVRHSKSGESMWALVSKSKPGKVLEYFGKEKPSKETFNSAERRVQYFKHK
jgi:hypothetical protein